MPIQKICVLGAGVMGHGIAQVCAQGGYQVSLFDIEDKFVQGGLDKIRKFLDGSVEKKRMTREEADAVVNRIKGTANLETAAKDADLVIEAIVENIDIKRDTFSKLDKFCPPHAILASNTSYQSITEMARVTKRADKVLGMHWFNPPQLMRGVEVVRTDKTSQEVVDTIVALAKKLGKVPGICKDTPGFIVNRILQPWYNESYNIFDEGLAAMLDIDTAIKTAYNYRMGPFELRDLVGLDIAMLGTETIYKELKNDRFKPPQCLVRRFRAGDLGRKTGRGFYEYK